MVLTPDPDAFAALARSSPWRWSTLRFSVHWTGPYPTWPEPVRAWLRRPAHLRVETLGRAPVQVVRQERQQVGVLTADGGRTLEVPWPRDPGAPRPELRADGLVGRRPDRNDISHDPMFQNYAWIAMLDPVELADGVDRATGELVPGLELDDVGEVQHGGRPAWEAVVRPTDAYEPRCGCCSLLRNRAGDLIEYADHPQHVLPAYPEAYRVRLDVGTGVCVLIEEIGGLSPGKGHDLRIEAVDEPMDDGLFVEPPRPSVAGWSPTPS